MFFKDFTRPCTRRVQKRERSGIFRVSFLQALQQQSRLTLSRWLTISQGGSVYISRSLFFFDSSHPRSTPAIHPCTVSRLPTLPLHGYYTRRSYLHSLRTPSPSFPTPYSTVLLYRDPYDFRTPPCTTTV